MESETEYLELSEEFLDLIEPLKNYDIYDAKRIIDIGILSRELGIKYFKDKKNNIENNLLEIKIKELEEEKNELINEKYNLREEMYKEIENKRNDFYNRLEEREKQHEKQLKEYRLEMNTIVDSRLNEKTTDLQEKIQLRDEKILIRDEKIKNLTNDVLERKKEIDELRKKYVLSTKGKSFEEDIYNNLFQVIERHLNNIWDIQHVGSAIGHKGDIILKHKITNKTIMLDPKNHDTVSSAHRDKFINDMKSENNGFDGGMMISRGTISTKTLFQKDIYGKKPLWYVSNYVVGQERYLLTLIEDMHLLIVGETKEEYGLSELDEKLKTEFTYLKQQKQTLERMLKDVNNKITETKQEYTHYFNEDIEITKMVDSKQTVYHDDKNFIMKYLDDNLEECSLERMFCKVEDIKREINKLSSKNVDSKTITKCINIWISSKSGVKSKYNGRSIVKGYKIINMTNDIVEADEINIF